MEETEFWSSTRGNMNSIQQGRGSFKYAPEVRLTESLYWHPAMSIPSKNLVIKVGQWMRLYDWPDILFLCGGVLVKSNNIPLVITMQGMHPLHPHVAFNYVI